MLALTCSLHATVREATVDYFDEKHASPCTDGILSLCESPEMLRGLQNVTTASVDIAMSKQNFG